MITLPSPLRRFPRRFARAEDGVAAVEFALVGLPFFFMLFCILELGLVFVVSSVLENATVESSRLIRTGQAHEQGMSKAQFKNDLCSRMIVFASQCNGRLEVDVREIPRFTNPNPPPPSAGGFPSSFDRGEAGDIMLVRVWYRQPLFTTFLSQALARYGSSDAVLGFTTTFRNEPFGPSSPGGPPNP